MVGWYTRKRLSPIGVDIGTRSVKLLQLDNNRQAVHEAARWDLPADASINHEIWDRHVVDAIRRAREGRSFRGRQAVFCLHGDSLFVQNIRVAQASGDELTKIVHCEAAGRLPFGSDESEIRYLEAADVRQGDSVRREVILLACRRPSIQRIVRVAEESGLTPAAIDVEPAALLRCYSKQFRRDDDQHRRMLFVNIGASMTTAVIARGGDAVFIKYVDVGGRQLDEAVAKYLRITLADASALRRHNGDRRAESRDPEIERSIAEAIRPELDRLGEELSRCLRYYSVTFRGQPLTQAVVGGGEATDALAEHFASRLGLPCELGSPLRSYRCDTSLLSGRVGQWDVVTGLALWETPT